jgi:hypothetical protein
MRTVFTYIEMDKDGQDGWNVRNRFTRLIIGKIKFHPFVKEYCYEPRVYYVNDAPVLSTTNLKDIMSFIKKLVTIDKALTPNNE